MIHTKTYAAPPVDTREILRYAGVRGESAETEALLQTCLAEAAPLLTYQVCWSVFPLSRSADAMDLGFARTASASLSKHLGSCQQVLVFAATTGIALDRLIHRYNRLSPARALLLQAIGTERIEALCDTFCQEMATQQSVLGGSVTHRFSPGYGDLPLSLQQDIFQVLNCHRTIGLTLNESLLMSPSKSVTALLGLSNSPHCPETPSGCAACQKTSCAYRRTT